MSEEPVVCRMTTCLAAIMIGRGDHILFRATSSTSSTSTSVWVLPTHVVCGHNIGSYVEIATKDFTG
jgi:hypothetical protein